nr:MAG TPA: hypothetical protein [Caudoviricetes sp.]
MSVRITGDVCTYLASFVRGKGTIQWRRAGVVCPASRVDNAGRIVPRLTVSYWCNLKRINYV